MSDTPNFGELLAPMMGAVPELALPRFLATLERGAAARYRLWAEQAGDDETARGLTACAGREDEIASRVEQLVPIDGAGQAAIDAAFPAARDAYFEVFAGLSAREQWRIQASAERQGAAAWRGMVAGSTDSDTREVLEGCALLEEENAAYLESLLQG